MVAKYIMQEVKDLNNEGDTLLYPRMVIRDSYGTDELAEYISAHTSFSPAEVKGVIELLGHGIARTMAQGRSVRIDGIGLFTPSLAIKEGKEREEPDGSGTKRNAASIRVGDVRFRADRQLVRETDLACNLERESGGKSALCRSRYTPQERLALAKRYLEEHPVLTVGTYASLTGLSRTTAGKELRRWYETEGSGIGISGMGTHRVYVLRGGEERK